MVRYVCYPDGLLPATCSARRPYEDGIILEYWAETPGIYSGGSASRMVCHVTSEQAVTGHASNNMS